MCDDEILTALKFGECRNLSLLYSLGLQKLLLEISLSLVRFGPDLSELMQTDLRLI